MVETGKCPFKTHEIQQDFTQGTRLEEGDHGNRGELAI